MDLLSKRMTVDYRSSDDFTTSKDAQNLAWDISQHYLDMMICVGAGLGLGPIIPNQEVNSLYQVDLDFSRRHRAFHAKYCKLGFCPKESMLWIGKTPSTEDIWVAWVPNDESDQNDEEEESGNTILSERHYRATVMFFAKMLSQIPYRDLFVEDDYPDLTDKHDFEMASNIM
jgi:hypothetical protein